MKKLVIATRRSRLALWQAQHIAERLQSAHAGLRVELLPMSTRGDELIDRRLDEAGGKGLFVKELENAMADGRADLAVHSMKDVPAELPPGFVLAAITAREDPRDAFVSSKYSTSLAEMPNGATVGTSSLRRQAQIVERHPGLEVRLLRGNVDTRLAKLDRGEYHAIVLAAAGLTRLGLACAHHGAARRRGDAAGAGAGRAWASNVSPARAEVIALLAPLADAATSACVRAERTVSRVLGGSCTLPLAALLQKLAGNRMRLRALVASSDGKRVIRSELEGEAADPEALGNQVAQDLRRQGADAILGL